jgi:hypothetical protein
MFPKTRFQQQMRKLKLGRVRLEMDPLQLMEVEGPFNRLVSSPDFTDGETEARGGKRDFPKI